jgi:hypothetical protein
MTAKPKFVGLKMFLLLYRTINLLEMVIRALKNAIGNELVRSNKQRDKPEIDGLRGSNSGSLKCREKITV